TAAELKHEVRTMIHQILGYIDLVMDEIEECGLGGTAPVWREIREDAQELLHRADETFKGGNAPGREARFGPVAEQIFQKVEPLARPSSPMAGNSEVLQDVQVIAGACQRLVALAQAYTDVQ